MNMNDLNKYIVCDWFFDNNTQVSIDKNKKTITLSIAPDRHHSNMEVTNSFEDFLNDIPGIQTVILNNPDIQKKNVAKLIIDTVSYYESEKYIQDVENHKRESKRCLEAFVELNNYLDIQNVDQLVTTPNFSKKEIKSEKYFSDFVNEVKGVNTVFNYSFRDNIFFNLIEITSGKEIEIKLPVTEEWMFYNGFFANNLYFLNAKEQIIVMNEMGEIVHFFNKNEPILNYFRINKIAWLDNTLFLNLSNKIDYSETIWLALDYKTGIIKGKVSTIAQKTEIENDEELKQLVEEPIDLKQKSSEEIDSKGNENKSKKMNDAPILAIISKIYNQQKNTIKAYGIIVFILNLGPTIGICFNLKAIYFLIPTIILSIILIIQMVKIKKYTLKYGTASIIELTAASTPTNTNYKHSTIVNFVLVNEHTLYNAKIEGIDFNQKETAGMMKYQISPEMRKLIADKKEITFITKGKNEIATILDLTT